MPKQEKVNLTMCFNTFWQKAQTKTLCGCYVSYQHVTKTNGFGILFLEISKTHNGFGCRPMKKLILQCRFNMLNKNTIKNTMCLLCVFAKTKLREKVIVHTSVRTFVLSDLLHWDGTPSVIWVFESCKGKSCALETPCGRNTPVPASFLLNTVYICSVLFTSV